MTEQLLTLFQASTGVCTDTRQLKAGQLFFALRGPSFNGNEYAAKALELGASYAVVDDSAVAVDERYVIVPDVLEALQNLARDYRRTWTAPVIALTGSNGKTTTKELLRAALATTYRVSATVGNLNNHIGVPLTLLAVPPDAEVVVVEMGANHQREIAALAAIAEPSHGMITNIGRAHLEGFGGIEGVRIGKGELFDYLAAHNGHAFVNTDDAEVSALAERVPRQLRYSTKHPHTDSATEGFIYSAQLVRAFPKVKAKLSSQRSTVEVSTQLPGDYNYRNMVLAAAVASYFKVPNERIAKPLEAYVPGASRSETRDLFGSTVLFDAYNANPDSTAAALSWLASRPEQHKVAVLGELAELGAFAKTAHTELVAAALAVPNLTLAMFGAAYEHVQLSPADEARVYRFAEAPPLRNWLHAKASESDVVILIKGSRSNRLERVLEQKA